MQNDICEIESAIGSLLAAINRYSDDRRLECAEFSLAGNVQAARHALDASEKAMALHSEIRVLALNWLQSLASDRREFPGLPAEEIRHEEQASIPQSCKSAYGPIASYAG